MIKRKKMLFIASTMLVVATLIASGCAQQATPAPTEPGPTTQKPDKIVVPVSMDLSTPPMASIFSM